VTFPARRGCKLVEIRQLNWASGQFQLIWDVDAPWTCGCYATCYTKHYHCKYGEVPHIYQVISSKNWCYSGREKQRNEQLGGTTPIACAVAITFILDLLMSPDLPRFAPMAASRAWTIPRLLSHNRSHDLPMGGWDAARSSVST
jgi:hypothetical protein